MVVELSTDYVKSVNNGVYGYGFYHEVADEYWQEFLNAYDEATKEKIEELLDTTDFAGTKLFDIKRGSPEFYNFRDDWLEFKIEISDSDYSIIYEKLNDDFFDWAYDNYKSYDGFISCMPYTKEKYLESLKLHDNKALGMWIGYQIDSNNDLEYEQKDLLDTAWEIIARNGYGYDEEMEDYYE